MVRDRSLVRCIDAREWIPQHPALGSSGLVFFHMASVSSRSNFTGFDPKVCLLEGGHSPACLTTAWRLTLSWVSSNQNRKFAEIRRLHPFIISCGLSCLASMTPPCSAPRCSSIPAMASKVSCCVDLIYCYLSPTTRAAVLRT